MGWATPRRARWLVATSGALIAVGNIFMAIDAHDDGSSGRMAVHLLIAAVLLILHVVAFVLSKQSE